MEVRRLTGFADAPDSGEWQDVLAAGETNRVFLTRGYLQAWWESFGRGELLFYAVVRNGRVVALAPLFADSGMVFFVGSGGSDYLDFIGEVGDPETLAGLLTEASRSAPGFLGFRFYHLPSGSRTVTLLAEAAECLGLDLVTEGTETAPALDLDHGAEGRNPALSSKGPARRERWFQREGELVVRHYRRADDVEPQLESFFDQHVTRWNDTPFPSLFLLPKQRSFYHRLARSGGEEGWLRFTRLDWEGRPIAFHFGFCHAGSFLWYKPTYDPGLSKRSPGQVLLRQLLIAASGEGARVFDFGIGDEAFKERFATRSEQLLTLGLYPKRSRS